MIKRSVGFFDNPRSQGASRRESGRLIFIELSMAYSPLGKSRTAICQPALMNDPGRGNRFCQKPDKELPKNTTSIRNDGCHTLELSKPNARGTLDLENSRTI